MSPLAWRGLAPRQAMTVQQTPGIATARNCAPPWLLEFYRHGVQSETVGVMREGIYQLVYAGATSSAVGVFVLRNGAFSGVGEKGAHYTGNYKFQPARNLYKFEGQVQFPPNTATVTGFVAGDQGSTVKLEGELSTPDPATRFSLDFAGRAVDVSIKYVSPIPG